MNTPQKMIKNAEKIFGPVAKKIGERVLNEINDETLFEDEYIKQLVKIAGNEELIRNILEKE